MGRTRVYDSQPSFQDGLNTVSDPASLLPTQATQLTNYRLNAIGGAQKRGGTRIADAPTSAMPGAVTYGFSWANANTNYSILVTDSSATTGWNRGVYSGGVMGLWQSLTFCQPPTLFTMCTSLDSGGAEVLVCPRTGSNGIATLSSDFTTVTNYAAGSIPLTGVCLYNRRVWGWGANATAGANLYFSDYDNPSSLNVGASGGGVIKVRTFSSNYILACAPLASSLLIFHATAGISRLSGYGQNDITAVPQGVASDVALIGPRALTTYQGVCYFMTRRGLCLANEGAVTETATIEKPDPVVPILAADPTNAYATTVLYNRQLREVWVMVPSNGLWVYNTLLKSWSGPFDGPYNQANAQAHIFEVRDSGKNAAPLVMMSSATGQTVLECDYTSYKDLVAADSTGGSAWVCTLQAHRMFGGGGGYMYAKSWRWFNVLMDIDSGTSVLISGGITGFLVTSTGLLLTTSTGLGLVALDTQVVTSTYGGQTPYYVNASGSIPYIDVTITDSNPNQAIVSRIDAQGFLLGQR